MLIKRIEQFLVVMVLIGQLWCQGWYFPGISVYPAYLLCLLALTALSILVLCFQNNGIISIKGMFAPLSLLLILNIGFVFVLNGNLDIGKFMLIICSFAFCLACTQAFQTKEEVNTLLKWYVFIVLVSALVELGQANGIEFCTELWEALHEGDKAEISIEGERYLGLASDALIFAYHVSAAMAILFYIQFKRANFLIKAVLFAVFFYALYTNATRSGLIAVFIMFAFWALTAKKQKGVKGKVMTVVGVVALVSVVAVLILDSSMLLSGTRFGDTDGGAQARMPMLLTAFNHALRYPLGMGVYKVQSDLVVGANTVTFSYVTQNTAHNFLGNCVASYGFIGLGLMLALYVWAFVTYRRKKKQAEDPTIYMIAMCGLIGLVVNALFHSSYMLDGELSSFMFFAILHTAYERKHTDNKPLHKLPGETG